MVLLNIAFSAEQVIESSTEKSKNDNFFVSFSAFAITNSLLLIHIPGFQRFLCKKKYCELNVIKSVIGKGVRFRLLKKCNRKKFLVFNLRIEIWLAKKA